jgi:hypothetical protein
MKVPVVCSPGPSYSPSPANPFQAIGSPEDASFDLEVQKIFFQALAPLFTHLRGHVREGPNGLSYFDAHDYVHRQAVGAQAFCRALVETAAFRKLLTEMILTRPSLGLPFEALSKQLTDHTDLDCPMDGATLPDQRPPKDVDGSISESELFQTVKSFQSCASENSHATSRPCQPSRTSQVMLVHQTAKTSLSCCF